MRCKTCGSPLHDLHTARCERCGAGFDPADPRTFLHKGGSTVRSLGRIALTAVIVGAIGFALGFCGPMVLTPSANQGPLLGIFITGPLGVAVGVIIGVIREISGRG